MPHHDYWREVPDDPKINELRWIKAIHKIHTHVGYNYPGCTMEELKKLEVQPEYLDLDLLTKWKISNMDRATANLENFLSKPPGLREMMAINRLKAAWNDKNWTPDVAIKCFNDIDRAYFGRQMKGRVMLCWRESEKTIRRDCGPNYQHNLGFTTGGSFDGIPPTVQIQLNAQLIFCSKAPVHNGVRQTFGTLAHECIHAYLTLSCGLQAIHDEDAKLAVNDDPFHGEHYTRCATAPDRRTMRDFGFEVTWNQKPEPPRAFVRYPG